MELEIHLDVSEAAPEEQGAIRSRVLAWHAAGAGSAGRTGYGRLLELGEPLRFRVDPGPIDALTAISDLRQRLKDHRVGLSVRFRYS